ncbi:hypothetical protein T06_12838, partial [Trichinella sp. T6]
ALYSPKSLSNSARISGSSTFCNAASFSSNSWYTPRNAMNCDWKRFSYSVRVLLEQFCSSLLLRLKSLLQILQHNLTTHNAFTLLLYIHLHAYVIVIRGGVTLRISSKIYPRCLFSLTPNVIETPSSNWKIPCLAIMFGVSEKRPSSN